MSTSLGIYNVRPQHDPILVRAWGRWTVCSRRGGVHIWLEITACAASRMASVWVQLSLSVRNWDGQSHHGLLCQEPSPGNVRNALSIYSAGSYWLKAHGSSCMCFVKKFGSPQNTDVLLSCVGRWWFVFNGVKSFKQEISFSIST